jgi:hypothetical protein
VHEAEKQDYLLPNPIDFKINFLGKKDKFPRLILLESDTL